MTNKIGDIDNELKQLLADPYKYGNNISIDHLVELLKKLSYHYYHTDTPLVPDSVFDLLKEILEERDPTNEYLKEIGAKPVSKDLVKLPYPMASLNKIKPEKDILNAWKKKYHGPYVLSDKLDGVSALLYKNDNKFKLFTRGDATSGQDISHLISYVLKDKYKPGKIPDNSAIRGELIISKKNFEKIKDQYANARNTVSGLVNSKNYSIDVAKLTDFVSYAIVHPQMNQEEQMNKLKDWELPLVTYKVANNLTMDMLGEYLQKRRKDSEYEIDGIVVIDSSKIYNVKDKNPEYGFAFKMLFEDQVATTEILDVQWNISKHGYLKPVVKIKPVNLVGVNITNITAFNARYVVDNVLGPGAVIKIVRSGDVIPHILEVIKPAKSGKPKLPDIPYKWNDTNIDLIAKDVHGAAKDTIITKQITSFFEVLGVKHISEGIVRKLVEHNYKTIPDILNADLTKLDEIEGVGYKLLNKIYTNILDAFKNTNLQTLMAASNTFGRGLSVKKLNVIVKAYPNIMNEKWNKDELKNKILELPGFNDITASQFVGNFDKFKKFFQELEKVPTINIKHLKRPIITKKPSGDLFHNKKIVFTGFRSKELEEFIVNNGGVVTTAVSKNTDLLIHAPGEESSSKYMKANELGIEIMSVDKFKEKYNL